MSKSIYLILLGIIILFLAQVLYNPTIRCVEDEPWVSAPAYALITQGKLTLQPIFATEQTLVWPPLLQLLLAPIYKIAGVGLIQGRALIAFLGLLTVILTFYAARSLFNPYVALLATGFVAVDNLFFLASRTSRSDSIVTFFTLLAVYFFLIAVKRGANISFFLSGIMVTAGMSTHPNGFLGLVSIVVLLILEYKTCFFTKKEFYVFLLGVFVASIPYIGYVIITDYQNGFEEFSKTILRRAPSAEGNWLINSIKGEVFQRYSDFIQFPYRIHIAIISVAALIYAFISRKKENIMVSSVIITHFILFILIMGFNKSVRYLAIISPFASMLVASVMLSLVEKEHTNLRNWLYAFHKPRYLLVILLVILFGFSQLAGNFLYIYRHRDTKYYEFTDQIKSVIPPNASIYATVTYWLAFYDHPYYSYNRVDFETATQKYHPDIYILDDRVMMFGESGGHEWDSLRVKLYDFVSKHGVLIGKVNNWFYGNINIYRVK